MAEDARVDPEGPPPDADPESDPQVEARRRAAVSFLRTLGDPILKSRATPVDRFDAGLAAQVERMGALMADALGVGLAAPQVGIAQRVFVYRVGEGAPVIALVNPDVEWVSEDEEEAEEGCLSIPGVAVDVRRPLHVRVRGRDPDGEERVVEASGLEARVLQHEIDHLDGVLILDRTTREQRKEAMRALREAADERRAA
jgi:peptide deformylase